MNPISKVSYPSVSWFHKLTFRKVWQFTCPNCGTKRTNPGGHNPDFQTRKQAKDSLHAHLVGRWDTNKCPGRPGGQSNGSSA